MRTLYWLAIVVALAAPVLAQDDANIHHMLGADGELDMGRCGLCHEDDLSLSRSKLETCTMCHSAQPHAGAAEHLRASPASVAQKVAREGSVVLPLAEDGRIYCGTCHIFHDPAVAGEKWLSSAPVVSTAGVAGAVRSALSARLETIAKSHGTDAQPVETFVEKGTRQMRLPVADGQLCKHCHGYGK